MCPTARARGGGRACCQRAGEGPAAPLGRDRAPGGSALADAVGAGGGGRAGREGEGGEGRGEERGKGKRGEGLRAGGGARADGEGLQPCEAWKGYSVQHPNSS